MKKLLLLLVVIVYALNGAAIAQTPATPPPQRHTVSFESQHGEAFVVFMDGNEVNRMPQSIVSLHEVSSQTHEVVVVLKRPASKAAVLRLRPGEPRVKVSVSYSQSADCLVLYTPSYNREGGEKQQEGSTAEKKPQQQSTQQPADSLARPVTDDDVTAMAANMQRHPFNDDRLALGKVYVVSASLTAAQIVRLARVLDYTASQVELLKYAYVYCADKANYPQAIATLLPLTADRQKVLDYIATQP